VSKSAIVKVRNGRHMDAEMGGRQRQAQETKKRIFQAAIALMAQNGYHGTKVEEICKAAKVSIGAFYHHFQAKDDIFSVTYDEADAYFETDVAEELRTEKPGNRIVAFFRIYAEFNQRMGVDMARVLYNGDNRWFIKRGRGMQNVLAAQIAESQSLGLISSDEAPESITTDLFVLARGIVYDWCLHGGEYDLSIAMQRLIVKMLCGFAMIRE
jgi:TetR/AcrR family transcriptional regulator, fatty acid metabolism regulator protein